MDEWMDALRRAGGAVRPGHGATEQVVASVARRRRRRGALTTLAAAAAVGGIIVGGVLLPADREKPEQGVARPSVTKTAQPGRMGCPTEDRVFSKVPPFPDLAEQQRVVAAIKRPDWKGFGVRHAAPSALGPVALVAGDLATARRALSKQGVAVVEKWDPSMAEVGVDADGQISQAVHWRLDVIVQDVRRRIRGVPGHAGIGIWEHNGAILLRWKAPVPDRIKALESLRFKGGGRVIVAESTYSEADFERAVKAVFASKVGPVHGARFCEEDQAIGLSVEPEVLRDRKDGLERQLTRIAGMPAIVIPEQKPTNLMPLRTQFTCATEHKIFTAKPPSKPLTNPDDLDMVMLKAQDLDGRDGFFELARWTKAGAVLVQWKRPVPKWVQDFEKLEFPGGGRIIVEGVRYSVQDIDAARRRVTEAYEAGKLDTRLFHADECGEGEGLIVGVDPSKARRERAGLQRRLADIAKMPVMVVEAQKTIDLYSPPGS